MAKIAAIGDFRHHAGDYRYVSFDLFDTLIKRRFLHVYDVHQAAGMYAQTLLGQHGERSPEEMASLRYRAGTALKESSERPIQEPSVDMVWDRLLAEDMGVVEGGRRADLVRAIVDFEHAMELANLGLVDGAAELLQALKDQGKVITAISDMYFSRAQMEEILARLGILHFFDHLYVSAEVNLTKQTGDLFRRVVADLGIEPREMLHVGDNAQSDIAMAIDAGVPCVHVEQFGLLELERSAYGKRDRIEEEVADVVKAHLFSVLVDARSRGVEHLYFLARDGLAIRRFLAAWNSPFRDAFLPVPDHSDLHLNRVLTCWANVDFGHADWLAQAVGIAFWLKEGKASAAELSALLGIEEVPEELGAGILTATTDTARVAQAYRHHGLEDAVRDAVVARRRQVERYLTDIGFFERKSVALVDVGYSGTVPRALNTLLVQAIAEGRDLAPPAMVLHLIATYDNYEINRGPALPHVHFADEAVLPVERLPDGLRGYSWIELFFKHPSLLPILGYVEQDGKLVPDLREGEAFPGETPAQRVEKFAAGRDEDIVFLWMAMTGRFDALRDPVVARFADPDAATIAQMRDEIFELDPIAGTRRSVILELPDADSETIAEAARKGDYWVAGSVAAARLAGAPAAPRAGRAQGSLWRRLLGRASGRRNEALQGFDPAFYRAFYPDLRHFGSDEALWRHFDRHGRGERRLGSRLALETRLQTECGAIPEDFQPESYLAYNPDVAQIIDTPERALDHYMRTGAREGRRYRPFLEPLVEDFERFRAEGRIVLNEAESRQHARGTSTFDLFLARHRIAAGRWVDEIVVPEFRAMHVAWAGPVANRAECILALCEQGLALMPALAFAAPFDLAFYRTRQPSLAGLDPAGLFRHYLATGSSAGLAPSEAAALHRLWGHPEYPECFAWEAWREQGSHTAALGGADRLRVLQAFVDADVADPERWLSGEGSAHLLGIAADRARRRNQRGQAARLLEAALRIEGDHGWVYHLLGDLAAEAREPAKAAVYYRKGIAAPAPNRWSHVNAADLLLNQGDWRLALAVLAQGRAAWQEAAPWRAMHTRAVDAWARDCAARIGRQPGNADFAEAEAIFAEVASRVPDSLPVRGPGEGLLVLTSRPASALRQDAEFHRTVTVVDIAAPGTPDYLAALLRHGEVILHEPTFSFAALHALQLARRMGKPVTLWLGDLTAWGGHPLAATLWGEGGEETSRLRAGTAFEAATVARWCDRIVVTLAGCTPLLRAAAAQVPIHDLTRAEPARRGATRARKEIIVTVAGTPRRSQLEAVAEALVAAAQADPALQFLVDKRLAALPALTPLAGRRAVLEGNPQLPSLARLISLADLVVALADGPTPPFAAWEDARAHDVPALVVPIKAASDAAWPAQTPLADDDLCAMILRATSTPARPAAPPAAALPIVPPLPDRPANPRRRRILLTNVWAPPQVIGGATRVMQDNVDYFIDNHADEFELAMFACDEHNIASGQFSVDSYRGVPVFRVAPPQGEQAYWRPLNAQATARFGAVLDSFAPDFVHMHCLQRLGAGLAEACRDRTIPYLVTLHDGWWLSDHFFLADSNAMPVAVTEDFFAQPHSGTVRASGSALRAQILRTALAGAERRLSVSRSFARTYAEAGFAVEVVENGVSRLAPVPRRPREGGRVQVCHVGGLEPHKGAFLVEAAARAHRFDNLALTIVDLAQGPDYRFHTRWGTTPVTLVGRMAPDELAEFYGAMDVLLAPSTCEESYGLVVREALAHGLWVVTGDRGAMAEPIRHGTNGFVVPVVDADAIAQVMAQIDGDCARFRQPPPAPEAMRSADDQSRELVDIYRSMPLCGADGERPA
ncbi:HAD-IA family hydrolase [Novosphingobium bradum]|uniref:HAD-IA family hydrolase n=1 Tax=Novosphingobium bradum TaxID=1737444 RepID=A0ABV7IPV4_9SPHN